MFRLFKVVFVLFIFCGMQFAAMNMKEPVPMQLGALAFLVLCIWRYDSKKRKEQARKYAYWKYLMEQGRFNRP
jgi:hypothetical protein